MRKFSVLFLLILSIYSCNDGDIITTELEFGDTFEACGELVLYKTKTDPNESLSLQINSPTIIIDNLITTSPDPNNSLLVVLNATESQEIAIGTANLFNFRSYTNPPVDLFCNDVPPTNIQVLEDFYSESGIAQFTMELIEDDDDGIPAELEDDNLDGDNDHTTNPLDTDLDGLPNYLDNDDDGDNVLTTSESVNYTATDGFTNALDTDNDGIPNYLDNDDDGDGVPTRNEEFNTLDNNPTNDISNNTVGPDYLNNLVAPDNTPSEFREHTVQQTFIVKLKLEGIQFPNIIYESLDFGTLQSSTENPTTATRTIVVPFI